MEVCARTPKPVILIFGDLLLTFESQEGADFSPSSLTLSFPLMTSVYERSHLLKEVFCI